MKQFSLVAQTPHVSLLPNAADAAGRTSGYRSLKHATKAYVIARVNQGNAATVLLSVLQAKDVAGTGSKAINVSPIWLCNDTSVNSDMIAQAAAATFTTDATLKDKVVYFEILPEAAMDINNGFTTIALSTGASNAANITSAELVIVTDQETSQPPDSYIN